MSNISKTEIDFLKLKSGLYLARIDEVSFEYVTTFDLRIKAPYKEEVMDTGAVHALEHLMWDYIKKDELWKDKIICVAPMGCRTGFYLMVASAVTIDEILPFIERMFDYISDFEGDIPDEHPHNCGYCVDMDLTAAKRDATIYYNTLIEAKKVNFTYPVRKERKSKKKE